MDGSNATNFACAVATPGCGLWNASEPSNTGGVENRLALAATTARLSDVAPTVVLPSLCEAEWSCPAGHTCPLGTSQVRRVWLGVVLGSKGPPPSFLALVVVPRHPCKPSFLRVVPPCSSPRYRC